MIAAEVERLRVDLPTVSVAEGKGNPLCMELPVNFEPLLTARC